MPNFPLGTENGVAALGCAVWGSCRDARLSIQRYNQPTSINIELTVVEGKIHGILCNAVDRGTPLESFGRPFENIAGKLPRLDVINRSARDNSTSVVLRFKNNDLFGIA